MYCRTIRLVTHGTCFLKLLDDRYGRHVHVRPPVCLFVMLVQLVVMLTIERYGELIAHLSSQGAGLSDLEMMRIARYRLADQTWVPCDGALIGPCQDGVAGQFAAVVADHHLRLAVLNCQPVEFARRPVAGEQSIGHQRQTLAAALLNHGQDSEATAVRELIRHEVERLAVVRRHRHDHGTLVQSPLVAATATHRKLLLQVGPEQLLVVDHIALPTWQNMQAPLAETHPDGFPMMGDSFSLGHVSFPKDPSRLRCRACQKPFKPHILVVQRLQPLGLGDLQPAVGYGHY